ncbi:hypothetical protein KA005_27770 [bacterium]|nr:hypothetical protein [bacterium]
MTAYTENSLHVMRKALVSIKESIPEDIFLKLERLVNDGKIHDPQELKSILKSENDTGETNAD